MRFVVGALYKPSSSNEFQQCRYEEMVNPYDEPVLYAHMRSVEHGRFVPAGEAVVSANDEKESTSGKVAQCEGQER